MSGSLHDVKNEIWMRTVLIAVIMLVVGATAYGVLHGAIGGVKENTWDEKKDEVAEAKMAWMDANKTIAETGTGSDIADAAGIKYEEAHEAEEDAHLSYLTWTTAGKTILVMFIIYAMFYGISGFYNSIQPEEEHHHGDDHEEHHGSASPILMAAGLLLFHDGFPWIRKYLQITIGT